MLDGWIKWAVGEGLMKTINSVLAKILGVAYSTAQGTFITTIMIGLVQGFSGFCLSALRQKTLFPSVREVASSILFGFVATVMTMLGLLVFTYPGADVRVVTFIITLSIVPGILTDWIFFGDRLVLRQYFGIGLFIFAGWAVIGFISLKAFLSLPVWILITFCIMFLYPINELITSKIAVRDVADPFVNNFWIGLSTVVFSSAGLGFFDKSAFQNFFSFTPSFWLVSFIMGVVVVAMISFKLIAYKGGGTIALKNS